MGQRSKCAGARKTLLRVPAGTKLLASDGATPPGPPNPNGERNAIHCELILPLSALNALKPQYKATLPESTAANAKTWRYWYLENVAGQAGGKPLSGWLCEKTSSKPPLGIGQGLNASKTTPPTNN